MRTLYDITETEKRFIDFCRKIQFAEIEIIIMDGEPKKVKKAIEQIRFDLTKQKESV